MKHHHNKSSEPSQRQRRVGEQIKQILSETLQRGHFDSVLLLNKSNTARALLFQRFVPPPI